MNTNNKEFNQFKKQFEENLSNLDVEHFLKNSKEKSVLYYSASDFLNVLPFNTNYNYKLNYQEYYCIKIWTQKNY